MSYWKGKREARLNARKAKTKFATKLQRQMSNAAKKAKKGKAKLAMKLKSKITPALDLLGNILSAPVPKHAELRAVVKAIEDVHEELSNIVRSCDMVIRWEQGEQDGHSLVTQIFIPTCSPRSRP